MKDLINEPVRVERGTCLGGCGKPRPWPWVTCGGYQCAGSTVSVLRLHAIAAEAGRPPWAKR